MKFLTYLNDTYLYTAQWYDFEGIADERVYPAEPTGEITFNGGLGPGGNTLSITTATPLRNFVRLDTLKDANGELLMTDNASAEKGAIYEVRGVAPIMNVWGSSEGYQVLLTRIETSLEPPV